MPPDDNGLFFWSRPIWRLSAIAEDRYKKTVLLEAILNFGYDDGGTTIYGRRFASYPLGTHTWTFWLASSGFGVNDNGDEVYLTHRSEETTDFASLLPDALFCYRPFLIHPEFATVIREALDEYVAGLPSHAVNSTDDYPSDNYPLKHWECLIASANQKANGST